MNIVIVIIIIIIIIIITTCFLYLFYFFFIAIPTGTALAVCNDPGLLLQQPDQDLQSPRCTRSIAGHSTAAARAALTCSTCAGRMAWRTLQQKPSQLKQGASTGAAHTASCWHSRMYVGL